MENNCLFSFEHTHVCVWMNTFSLIQSNSFHAFYHHCDLMCTRFVTLFYNNARKNYMSKPESNLTKHIFLGALVFTYLATHL